MGLITFRVDDSKAVARFNLVGRAADDMRPAYMTVGRVVANRIRLCFRLGIDPWGTPWAALRFRRGQPLRNTGRLQRSVTPVATANGVTIGTNLIQARTHQFGNVIEASPGKSLVFPGPRGMIVFAKKVTIPRRSFMPIREPGGPVALPVDWALEVTRALRAHIEDAMKKGA